MEKMKIQVSREDTQGVASYTAAMNTMVIDIVYIINDEKIYQNIDLSDQKRLHLVSFLLITSSHLQQCPNQLCPYLFLIMDT